MEKSRSESATACTEQADALLFYKEISTSDASSLMHYGKSDVLLKINDFLSDEIRQLMLMM